jgi:PIN domain nuclease of toxin-antitoxin system
LYESGAERFPEPARERLDAESLVISAMVEMEITFLHEIGRVKPTARQILEELAASVSLEVSPTALVELVREARVLNWTRDPFDRLICANTVADRTTLLTRDRRIRANFDRAVWD